MSQIVDDNNWLLTGELQLKKLLENETWKLPGVDGVRTWATQTPDGRYCHRQPKLSCDMIILRNKRHGETIKVWMGILTTALKS